VIVYVFYYIASKEETLSKRKDSHTSIADRSKHENNKAEAPSGASALI
jgi:hypothetical protein